MSNRVKRLVGLTAKQLGKAAQSGKGAYQRLVSGFRKGSGRKKKNDEPSVETDRNQSESSSEQVKENFTAEPKIKKRQRKKRERWSLDEFPVPQVPGRSRFHDFEIDWRIMRGVASEDFKYCTPIQEKALPPALNGKDLVARALTGTGKTAVFVIAIFCRLLADKKKWPPVGHPRALIIAPTRELVIQIAKDGKKLGNFSPLNIVAVYGGADYRKQQDMLEKRRCDIIVATPGRLLDFVRQKKIILDKCTILSIDEADRMLDMGFIPDVRRIISHLPDRGERQTMLFSATITDDVRRLADQWCKTPVSVAAGEETVDVERIDQKIYLTTEQEKYTLLYNLALQSQDARILIFANMKSEAAGLAARLKANGLQCQVLTGDVPQNKRMARLEAFRSGKSRLLVATDVAGRGIHIEGIKYVVNYTLPFEPEDYVHRIGRTGRAGADGVAVSFACETGSFYLPAIEEFIGLKLPCAVPEEHLLTPPPEPTEPVKQNKSHGRRPHRRSSSPSRSSRSRR